MRIKLHNSMAKHHGVWCLFDEKICVRSMGGHLWLRCRIDGYCFLKFSVGTKNFLEHIEFGKSTMVSEERWWKGPFWKWKEFS